MVTLKPEDIRILADMLKANIFEGGVMGELAVKRDIYNILTDNDPAYEEDRQSINNYLKI